MTMMTEFEASWPERFQSHISKRVIIFQEKKKLLKVVGQDLIEPKAIYNTVLGLQLDGVIGLFKLCLQPN